MKGDINSIIVEHSDKQNGENLKKKIERLYSLNILRHTPTAQVEFNQFKHYIYIYRIIACPSISIRKLISIHSCLETDNKSTRFNFNEFINRSKPPGTQETAIDKYDDVKLRFP